MNDGLKISLIVSMAVIIAAFLIGGRYTAVSAQMGTEVPLVYILDRFTGNVWFCRGETCRQSSPISN
jgi:hypothetical protein